MHFIEKPIKDKCRRFLLNIFPKMPNENEITDAQNLQNAVDYVKSVLGITGTDQDTILGIYIQSAVAEIYEMTGIEIRERIFEFDQNISKSSWKIIFENKLSIIFQQIGICFKILSFGCSPLIRIILNFFQGGNIFRQK